MRTHSILGCRDLSRVDFIVDDADRPWILEINTIPGFTRHSLLPMAAGQAGMSLPQLYDRLVRLALGGEAGKREERRERREERRAKSEERGAGGEERRA